MTSQHVPVLEQRCLALLAPALTRPGAVFVDATVGLGGHSAAVLQAFPQVRLIGLDRDSVALAASRKRLAEHGERVTLVHAVFDQLPTILAELGFPLIQGILFDLGVSSLQLDEAERGFSYSQDAPLDMRMDVDHGEPASAWLARAEMDDIARVIREYGEERFARQIAQSIVNARTISPIQTTRQLAQIVASAVRTREPGQDPATRTFQALRIHLNRELEEVAEVLPQALEALNTGGRLVVISFHSLEDRVVKQFMRAQSTPPEIPRGMAVRESDRPSPRLHLIGRTIRPSAAEISANPRSRSAVMRVAERTAA